MDAAQHNFLETVLRLFSKFGIKSVTMDDIARELGISKKTLYTFVTNKNELVEHVIDFQYTERMKRMKSLNLDQLTALEEIVEVGKIINKMIRDFNPSFHYDLSKYYVAIHKKMMTKNHDSMAQAMLHNIRKGKKEGFYRAEINEEIIVRMHIANVENLAVIGFYNDQQLSPEEVQSELFSYHIHAMLNQKGLEEYNRLLNSENTI